MFIQTEATPNPATLKFLPGRPRSPSARRSIGLSARRATDRWGGAMVRNNRGPHYWTDNRAAELREGNYPGAKTVNK